MRQGDTVYVWRKNLRSHVRGWIGRDNPSVEVVLPERDTTRQIPEQEPTVEPQQVETASGTPSEHGDARIMFPSAAQSEQNPSQNWTAEIGRLCS